MQRKLQFSAHIGYVAWQFSVHVNLPRKGSERVEVVCSPSRLDLKKAIAAADLRCGPKEKAAHRSHSEEQRSNEGNELGAHPAGDKAPLRDDCKQAVVKTSCRAKTIRSASYVSSRLSAASSFSTIASFHAKFTASPIPVFIP
jgi:hypothetical protein